MINEKGLKKFTVMLQTLSPVSLSPREGYCFYKGIDDKKVAFDSIYPKAKGINILYPFYQYGEYDKFDPKQVQYYIPGSSIKGALGWKDVYVDDADVKQSDLNLRTVNKLQHAKKGEDSDRVVKFKKFFDKVAIEMLNQNVEIEVTLYAENKEIISNLIGNCAKQTKEKLEVADTIIGNLIKRAQRKKQEARDSNNDQNVKDWQDSINQLECFQKALKESEGKDIFFLGGYKGELFSRKRLPSTIANDYQGTFYQDNDGNPFGLVEILFKD